MEREALLKETSRFNTLGSFIDFVAQKITEFPQFYACVAVESNAGTEFAFFMPSSGDSENSMISTVSAITIVTSATKVFLGYSTSISNDEVESVSESQKTIFFASSAEGSHPFMFFDLHPNNGSYGGRLTGGCQVVEPVPDGIILGSDLHQYIINNDEKYKALARKNLEVWKPKFIWDWKRYDKT